MKRVPAPRKFSAAINMALADLRKIEKDKQYKVDMDAWHRPEFDFDIPKIAASNYDMFDITYGTAETKMEFSTSVVCAACFAGSIMAKTLGAKPEEDVMAGSFGKRWYNVFLALDYLRIGDFDDAVMKFYAQNADGSDRTVRGLNAIRKKLGAEVREDKYDGLVVKPLENKPITEYHKDPAQFKRDMKKIANRLEKAGF